MEFYVNKLGFQLVREPVPMGPNSRWIEVGLPEGTTTIILANHTGMQPGSVEGIMMETKNIDADVETLQGAGVQAERSQTPWGPMATIKDPDGNSIVLHEPAGE